MIPEALYFFVPAYIANMAPVFFRKMDFLNIPVDFGKTWHKKRILGDNKTWRGILFGTICGAIFFEIQRLIYNMGSLKKLALIDYSSAPLFLGALMGFSALFGDSVKSFFKRRINVSPGRPWIPFDQVDFLVFPIILTSYWSHIKLDDALLLLLIIFFLTILVQFLGYKLKLKKDKL